MHRALKTSLLVKPSLKQVWWTWIHALWLLVMTFSPILDALKYGLMRLYATPI